MSLVVLLCQHLYELRLHYNNAGGVSDKDEQMSIIADPAYKSPFELLVRQTEGVRVGPRAPLDLVVSFTPERLSKAEGVCSVIIRREDGGSWHYTPSRLTEGLVVSAWCRLETTQYFSTSNEFTVNICCAAGRKYCDRLVEAFARSAGSIRFTVIRNC